MQVYSELDPQGGESMTKVYPALIHKEEDGLWLEFPDLPGCYTQGDDITEIMRNAEEVLGTFIAVRIDYGEAVPEASQLEDITGEGTRTYVSTDVNKYHKDTKAVKRMISIPSWLNKEAEKQHISLSRILQEALKEKLGLA